ncbi:hypothetical protein OG205_10785 [Lentzea sp. NBC_00516]|uniref:hypothetical protein n=1 Tax=Lentzea sp. NBC_00516 TaxID=2903582 RepID=UPI002E804465|nr:hypothetical protein [Lentzea sp. NBC_00516]WUD27449.1 hypothetical protein OG205_10785 [Lentzea sp. NBC_00516]
MKTCWRVCASVLFLFLTVVGCTTPGTPKPAPDAGTPAATVRDPAPPAAGSTEPATPPPPVASPDKPAPARPAGGMPPDLVGTWSGGEGSQTGYTLTFAQDGRYELSHDRATGIPQFVERGLAGGTGNEVVLRPVDVVGQVSRTERTARWSVQKMGDVYGYNVELLVVVDIYGEFSYAKDE